MTVVPPPEPVPAVDWLAVAVESAAEADNDPKVTLAVVPTVTPRPGPVGTPARA